jgi:hypothetical protein
MALRKILASLLTDNSIDGSTITDGSIAAVDLSASAITDKLGYTPVDPAALSNVATSGSYVDLSDRPTLGNLSYIDTITSNEIEDQTITAVKLDTNHHLGGSDYLIRLNSRTILSDQTIPNGVNGISAGPIIIADNVTVVIEDGAEWSIV